MCRPAVPRFPPRRFFVNASGDYSRAAASMNAYARGASAVASAFHFHRIGCATHSQPIWYAPELVW